MIAAGLISPNHAVAFEREKRAQYRDSVEVSGANSVPSLCFIVYVWHSVG